jgi:glutathione synthase/RimK-type ligase-like ATP-grasp enzyme
MAELLGVFREAQYSPGRVEDDAAILTRAAAALHARGLDVALCDAEQLIAAAADPTRVRGVLAMCQSAAALRALDAFAARVPVVNTPAAIRHCYRTETVRLLRDAAVPAPETTLVATAAPRAHTARGPCWVKRGDVHAMSAGDVVFTATDDALAEALASLAARGIAAAAVQEHVEGTVLKFYAVADGSFFRAYGDVADVPAPLPSLWEVARAGAAALGLEVFGGDLVVRPDGSAALIDINDWPSFARCRDEAADAIASYVAERVAASTPSALRAGGRA